MSMIIQEFYLNSAYPSTTLNSTGSDVLFSLQVPVSRPINYEVGLRVTDFVCPISFFIINSSNNTLATSVGSYTIPVGNYTALSLNTALSTLMSGFTVSYSSTSNKLTFTYSSSFTFLSSSTCLKVLGFTASTSYASSSNALTSPYIVNLSGTSMIYIDIPNVTTYNCASRTGGGFTSIIKSILCNIPYGCVLSYHNPVATATYINEKTITYFRVRLLDDDFNLIDLNGQSFNLTLELTFTSNGLTPVTNLLSTET